MENIDNKTVSEKKINPRKQELIGISKVMREHVKNGEAPSINEAIKRFVYEPQGHTDLQSIHQWNKEGKRVTKGCKALLLWSAPLKGKVKAQESNEKSEDEEYKFWNVCYLFSSSQIEERKSEQI